jgi:hypothetical protein
MTAGASLPVGSLKSIKLGLAIYVTFLGNGRAYKPKAIFIVLF